MASKLSDKKMRGKVTYDDKRLYVIEDGKGEAQLRAHARGNQRDHSIANGAKDAIHKLAKWMQTIHPNGGK